MEASSYRPKKFLSYVEKKKKVTPWVYVVNLKLDSPPKIHFLAGQYIAVSVGPGVTRLYSIASPPFYPQNVELCVNTSPQGIGSKFFEKLKVGDPVEFMGPLGFFTLPEVIDENAEFYFLATGCGVAPIKSHILDLLEARKCSNKVKLYFGTRTEKDVVYRALFEGLQSRYKNFEYVLTLSRPSSSWKGRKGYVTKYFDFDVKYPANKEVYICGNPKMLESALSLLKEKGFNEAQIHHEKFF